MHRNDNDELKGMVLGAIGIAMFSVTLPATHIAIVEMSPVAVGLGRTVVAAGLAALMLALTRQPIPIWSQWRRLAVVTSGVVLGFPLLSAVAMQTVPPSHGAVMLGILPLATAAAGALVAGERPSIGFWVVGLLGSAIVVAFALIQGETGSLSAGDGWLLLAVLLASLSYAMGGTLAREIGGWQVISWALLLGLPVTVPAVLFFGGDLTLTYSPSTWGAFLYVAVFSQFVGFFFWNRGLALGGVARVGQVQLLQPFLTIVFAVWLVGDVLDARTIGFAALVMAVVALGRRMAVRRA